MERDEVSQNSNIFVCNIGDNVENFRKIIDRNNLQISGDTELINPIEPLDKKFEAFGFSVKKINGHDVASLKENLNAKPMSENKPSVQQQQPPEQQQQQQSQCRARHFF